MPLPSFSITGNVFTLLGNVSASEIVGNGFGTGTPGGAKVVFVSNVPPNYFVTFGGQSYAVPPVEAQVNSAGEIRRNGEVVRLLASDAGLNVDDLQWTVHIGGMAAFTFDAPADGASVDVSTLVPVPSVPITGIPNVPDGGTYNAGTNEYQLTAGGIPIGDPFLIPSAEWNDILNKPAFVASGADAPAARTALGATTVGDAVFTAADEAAARTAFGGDDVYQPQRRPNVATRVFGGRMGTLNVAAGTTFQFTCELADDFVAVRPIFANASATTSDRVIGVAASALESAADLNNSAGAWTAGTKDGFAFFATAIAPAVGRIAYTATDWIRLPSVARTDAGTKPLVAVRAYMGVNASMSVLGNGTDDFTNWASRTDGLLVAMRNQAVDAVTTPADFTSTTNTSQSPIVGVQYLSKSGQVVTVGAVGDSVTEGRGTYLGDSHVFQAARDVAAAAGRIIEYANFGWSTEPALGSGGFAARAHDVLESAVCPDVLVFPTGSPNDGTPSQVLINAFQMERNAVAAKCGERRVIPVFWTWLPVNTAVHNWGANDAYRVTDNARALAQPGLLVGDTSTLYSGTTSGGQVQIAAGLTSDNIHPNDAGNTAIKAALITPLTTALRYVQVREHRAAVLPAALPVHVLSSASSWVATPGIWIYTGTSADGSWPMAPREPSPRNSSAQVFYVFVDANARPLTLTRTGTDTFLVDGVTATSLTILRGERAIIINDGTQWRSIVIRARPAVGLCLPLIGVMGSAGLTAWSGANRCAFVRISDGGPVSKVRFEVGTSSGNVSVAVYRNTGTGAAAVPTGAPLATSGAVACPSTGIAEISLGSTVYLNAGDWLALSCDNTTATFRAFANSTQSLFSAGGLYCRQDTAHPAPTVGTLAAISTVPVLVGVA